MLKGIRVFKYSRNILKYSKWCAICSIDKIGLYFINILLSFSFEISSITAISKELTQVSIFGNSEIETMREKD